MDIAVLGTGSVGRAIAGRLHELGHHVTVGTRDPQATLARTEPDAMGNRAVRRVARRPAGVALATYAEAAAGAEVVVLRDLGCRHPRRARTWPAPSTWPASRWSTSATRSTSPGGFPPTLSVKQHRLAR